MINCGGQLSRLFTGQRLRGRWVLLMGVVCAGALPPAAAFSVTLAAPPVSTANSVRPAPSGQVERVQQCQQRVGPFVTQSTAYQRLRQAQAQGYGVSGVFPCYGGGGRGYCFNVFYPC